MKRLLALASFALALASGAAQAAPVSVSVGVLGGAPYDFSVANGALVLVIDVGI